MANPYLSLRNITQYNAVGSTISTGYVNYVSTAGRLGFTSTLSALQVSTLAGSTIQAVSTVTAALNTSTVNTTGTTLPLQVGGTTYATVTSSGLKGVAPAILIYSTGTVGSNTFPITAGTYSSMWIRLVGAGGSGALAGGGGNGSAGGNSSVTGPGMTTMIAVGGAGGVASNYAPNPPSLATGGNVLNTYGSCWAAGSTYSGGAGLVGGVGGASILGSSGASAGYNGGTTAGYNGGGGGGASSGGGNCGGGGNAGSYCESIIPNPAGTYTVTIGQGGPPGNVSAGAGGNGFCVVIGYY